MLFEVNPLSEYAPEADADIAVASLVLSVETEPVSYTHLTLPTTPYV